MTSRLKSIAAMSILLALSSVTVHADQVHRICVAKGLTGTTVTIKLSTGCVSSTTSVIGHDFIVKAREGGSVVDIIGAFKHRNPDAKIVTADCMGAKSLTFDVVGVTGNSLELIENGTSRGSIDLAFPAGEQCLERNRVNKTGSIIAPQEAPSSG
jgi:hypothetical protein